MTIPRPGLGDRKSEVLSLRNMQSITETVNRVRSAYVPEQDRYRSEQQVSRNSRALLFNDSGQKLVQYQAVQVADAMPDLNNSSIQIMPTLESVALVHTSNPIQRYGNPAVCDQEIPVGKIGWCTYRGLVITRVFMPTGMTFFNKVDLDFAQTTPYLRVSPQGSGQLIAPWTLPTNAQGLAAVYLGNPADVSYVGKATQTIIAPGSGTIEIYSGKVPNEGSPVPTTHIVTAWLDWMHGNDPVSSGKEVMIKWFHDEQLWRIVGAECEAGGDPPLEWKGEWQ